MSKEISSLNFNSLVVDFRHYQSITNVISTAFRFYGGTAGGKDAIESVRFRVGGTSYLPFFNRATYSHIYDVHSFDQVYYDIYVMPLRGLPIGSKYGQNVLLMRDLTDTMYNSRQHPFVSHFRGTDLVVEHIERYWCPTITSTDFTKDQPFRFKNDTQ